MYFLKILVFVLLHFFNAGAMLKRPDPDLPMPPPPPKHIKLEEDFVEKFRKFDINKKGKIDADLVAPFLGHGGTYEAVQPVASKLKTIESDHAPHYSILDYLNTDKVNVNDLPENIRKAVEKRKLLHDELQKTDYPKNEEKLKILGKQVNSLRAEIDKPIRVNKWEKSLQKRFTSNINDIKKIEKDTVGIKEKLKLKPGDPALELKIAKNQQQVNDLMKQNADLRHEAEKSFKTPEKKAKLAALEAEYGKLEKVNRDLSKALDDHNANIKKAMGVLSIPYDKHRIFPSTGNAGLDDDIRKLKYADAATAKAAMEGYDKAWTSNLKEGIKKGYFKNADDFAVKSPDGKFVLGSDGKKVYDFQKLWEHNFDSIIEGAHGDKSGAKAKPKPGKGKKAPITPEQAKATYMKRLHETYAKKFVTTTIYYIKTPKEGYSRLVNLYVAEYKLYLKGDFNSYKLGLHKLLETNADFEWINSKEVKKLVKEYKLDDIDSDPTSTTAAKKANQWNEVEELIKIKSDKSGNPMIPEKGASTSGTDAAAITVCSSSTRRKRSAAANGCIFFSKQHHDTDINNDQGKKPDLDMDGDKTPSKVRSNQNQVDLDESVNKKVKIEVDVDSSEFDGASKPKISLPSDADTVSIDSKRLNSYLSQLDDGDINSARIKQAVVEHTLRNSDKLTGSPEDIAKTKAMIKQENLDGHTKQVDLARNTLRNNGKVSPKALSKYEKVKISASKLAAKASKFTSTSGKFSNSYGKIMLAKGVVTALRHGDYTSLALMGGRIGLEFALQGVTKLGKHIAKKATTKFMTKFGSQVLGKMAGPVGAIADIGINVYSITKSVKILNDPNASKFDQNDAIADIVADSIDIAVTATAAVLSLAFPPLAPVFAAVAFIVNLFTTIVVAFYKAANHVDRVNDQIPLLDYEKTTEYWRYMSGSEISGYIQELIDIKKANNIAVNMTVQFLRNNPDYIGRVFPSKTMHDPEAACELQRKICKKLWHFIPAGCSYWESLSDCDGYGGYCSGYYSGYKCQSDSGTGMVLPLIGHDKTEYRCQCGPDPPPVWGYEVVDNSVDFTEKQYVYLQRAAPDFEVPSDFNYMCKPSSMSNEGKRVSKWFTEYEYLCKGAIGIIRRNSKGKFMLYDLGIGNDRVTLKESETVDNLFVVKDGDKQFLGNAGDDTFVFSGPCSSLTGTFNGKGYKSQGNSLVLDKNCNPYNDIFIDLPSNNLKFENNYGSVTIMNIQRVIGRSGYVESIIASCATKLVVPGGGRSSIKPDKISVPSCGSYFELTISVNGHTIVDASRFTDGKLFTLLQGELRFRAMVPKVFKGTLLFKFDNVGSLLTASVDSSAITLGFSNSGSCRFDFQGNPSSHGSADTCSATKSQESQLSLVINESNKLSKQLMYNLDSKKIQCAHSLERGSNVGGSIYGYDFLDNLFHLKSGSWNAFGGKLNNNFILIGSDFSGSIDGRSGQSTLIVSDDFRDVANLEINLNSGFISGRNTIQMKNIHNVNGRSEFTERVITSCTTKSLDIGGAVTDYVDFPELSCEIATAVKVKGKITIVDLKRSGSVTIQAGYDRLDPCSKKYPLELSLSFLGGGETTLLLNFQVYQLLTASKGLLNIEGGNRITLNGKFPNVYFEEDNDLKSTLIEEDGKMLVFHELNNVGMSNSEKLRKGTNSAPNLFKLVQGNGWKVVGGNFDDTFSLVSNTFQGIIEGGLGKNSLFIGDEIQGTISINSNALWVDGRKTISFANIHEIHGRSEQPEMITVDCNSQYVGLKGGHFEKFDTVTIPELVCSHKMTIVAVGYTELRSLTEYGSYEIYVQKDDLNNLKFKSDIFVTISTLHNFAIQYPAYNLKSYDLRIEEGTDFTEIRLHLKLADNDNFAEFQQRYSIGEYESLRQNVNILFINDEFQSEGNVFINIERNEVNVLHELQESGETATGKTRRGATGAKNVFRLYSGNWEAFGGTLDDSFILNYHHFTGKIHGLGGVNSLILTESVDSGNAIFNLPEKTLTLDQTPTVRINSIQIVGGRKMKQDKVICACDTMLVMLDGGVAQDSPDVIEIQEGFCPQQTSIVVDEFTQVKNNASLGNFTYHIRTNRNFDINYNPGNRTNHAFKFEIPLEDVKRIELDKSELEISFEGGKKNFPLNFFNLPTFHIGQDQALVAELILGENETPQCSIIARSPFSESVNGINGAENGIIVQTSSSLLSVIGGDKDDNIFVSEVESILFIKGGMGTNRLQLSDELHRGKGMEVDLSKEKITFLDDSSSFVTVMKEITLFTGREHSFERVILGCDTRNLRFVEEIIIKANCAYDTRLEIQPGSRIIFKIGEQDVDEDNDMDLDDSEEYEDGDDDLADTSTSPGADGNDDEVTEEFFQQNELSKDFDVIDDEEEVEPMSNLEPSTFYYHFSSIHSFDIEVESFSQLDQTRHIFYLNFTLADLKSLRFSLKESRLIYSTFAQNEQEYSHLLAEIDESAMFYSQPEFMTSEGFILRISRYGEIMAVVANQQESLTLDSIQQHIIPRLSIYSARLGISFMLETGSDFIYTGNPNEISLLTNRENVPSHLVGFNRTTYEILDLDHDVFIYPQSVQEDSIQVIDLSHIISQIRSKTEHKYVPLVTKVENNLEIRMAHWTDMFKGKVILVNGTFYSKNMVIMLNSIAMELRPDEPSLDEAGNRIKRSTHESDEDSWAIKPRPIVVPEGHVYLFAAEDLEDGVEIREETENENRTFEYSKDENDLIITSVNPESIESGKATTFTIFEYYSPSPPVILDSDNPSLDNESEVVTPGNMGAVKNIQVKLGKEMVKISSNEPLVSETGAEVPIEFYEDILDREEYEIVKDIPFMPRKFEVPLMRKIERTDGYRYAAQIIFLCCTILLGSLIYKFCRKKPNTGKYSVKTQQDEYIHDEKQLMILQEFYEENTEDYEEPKLITSIQLREDIY